MQNTCRDCGRANCICKAQAKTTGPNFVHLPGDFQRMSGEIDRLRAELEAANAEHQDLQESYDSERLRLMRERDERNAQRVDAENQLTSARRQIDEAGRQVPVAYQYSHNGELWVDGAHMTSIAEWNASHADDHQIQTRALYAAPVPPQPAVCLMCHESPCNPRCQEKPSAAPEAVAKDAEVKPVVIMLPGECPCCQRY